MCKVAAFPFAWPQHETVLVHISPYLGDINEFIFGLSYQFWFHLVQLVVVWKLTQLGRPVDRIAVPLLGMGWNLVPRNLTTGQSGVCIFNRKQSA